MSRRVARRPRTAAAQQARKQGILAHPSPSRGTGIADALVIKDRDAFFLCRPDGAIPLEGRHGLGLYEDDCRFLRTYEIRLGGELPIGLAASAREGDAMAIELTNPAFGPDDARIAREQLAVLWHRAVDGRDHRLRESIEVENHGVHRAAFELELRFDAGFEDVFAVRGLIDMTPGAVHGPSWRDAGLVFESDGADGARRSTTISFDPQPDDHDGRRATWQLDLGPQARRRIDIEIRLATVRSDDALHVEPSDTPDGKGARNGRPVDVEADRLAAVRTSGHGSRSAQAGESPADRFTVVESDSPVLDAVLGRALRDLQILRSDNAGAEYFAAGVPWFSALFGRDSAITALETLAWDPFVAEQTLRVLAAWQGHRRDEYRDEEPGRILHELRVGELARIGAIPHSPLYASVDSTPLFCILLARHARWTGTLDLFRELRDSVDRALQWLHRAADKDGFLAYDSKVDGNGLVNQGWKDSGTAIVTDDGSIAEPPIALVEVQAYVHAARTELADLFERDGRKARAADLRRSAEQLRHRFEDRFWVAGKGTYALALQGKGRQARVVTSNPGHALWAGIAAPDRAQSVRDSLMTDDMYSGWGIRTLSRAERRYNPVGYHLGTVWPHDNAIIGAGFRRYGFDDDLARIANAMIDAASDFDEHRLPEVFAGDERSRFDGPVRYPVACHPQAWAAGAVPYLLTSLLGLEADGFANELRITRPQLPALASRVELRSLRVGTGQCDLRFTRAENGRVHVDVLRLQGDLQVVGQPGERGNRQPVAAGAT